MEEQQLIDELMSWITTEEEILIELDSIPLPDDYDALFTLIEEHKQRQEKATFKQPDFDKIVKSAKRTSPDKRRSIRTPGKVHDCSSSGKEFLNPRVAQLSKRWQELWLALMERMKKLQKSLDDVRIVSLLLFILFFFWKKAISNRRAQLSEVVCMLQK